MKIAILCFTEKGYALEKKIARHLQSLRHEILLAVKCKALSKDARIKEVVEESLQQWTEKQFRKQDGIIFIGAAGIAVRAIAAAVQSKESDPAILVIDEQGKYCIPLLSGHLGGANALAGLLAKELDAEPVITTATDLRKKWAVDVFAKKNGLFLSDMKKAKEISARILAGERINIWIEKEIEVISGDVPQELQVFCENERQILTQNDGNISILSKDTETIRYDIVIGVKKIAGTKESLYLIPNWAVLGLGCRKGTSFLNIQRQIEDSLEQAHIFPESIRSVASIDLKKEEPGILQVCEVYQLPFQTFSAEELSRAPGSFTGSEFVKQTTGVENVCERSAVCASKGGALIVSKQTGNAVTVAVAIEKRGIEFE